MSSTETTTAAIDPSAVWAWHVGEGLAEVDRLAQEWNALAHTGTKSPTADAIWTACAWRAFGSSSQTFYVHSLRDEQGRLLAVLPLVRTGRLVSCWAGLPDVRHTPCWDFAFDNGREGVVEAVIRHLLESASRIDLYQVPASSAAFAALTAAMGSAISIVWQNPAGQDAVLDLAGPWENLRASMSKKLLSRTEREVRRLGRMGRVSYCTLTEEDGLDEALNECFVLEAKGWKGQRGTAIINQPQTLRFYTDLAHASVRAGRLTLYLLRLDDRLIAFEFCLRGQGRIDSLKTSYDPDMAKHSPSNVLCYLLLREELEKAEVTSYHMGRSSEWKQRWANRTDDLVRMRIYRRCPGGIMTYLAGPRLRATLKKSQMLLRTTRWVHGLADGRTRAQRQR